MDTTNLLIFASELRIRSTQDRDAELSLLYGLADKVPHYAGSGDDSQEAIQGQIKVISGCMTFKEITKEHKTSGDYVMSSALDALECLRDDGEAPSELWLRMIGNVPTASGLVNWRTVYARI